MDIIFFIVIGGLWGSFANVCIYRLPINKNVALGRSFCTNCKKKIAWFDNVPVLSYLILRSKCRNCKKKISFQYFLVELLGILNFTVIYLLFGITLTTILLIILSLAFLIIFFIDLRHYIIPNSITYPMMILGFIKSFDPNLNSIFPNYINSLIGGIFGYVMIWSIIYFYKQIKKKDGMGLGDAKLFAVLGFWFGWISIPFIIFLSSIIALIYVLPDLLKNSKKMSSQIPFGPFIIIGTIFYLVFQEYFVQML